MANPLGELTGNHDFLSLFSGRLVTNVGDSLYFIAAMWLAYELTGSPLYTGIVGFASRAPSVLSFLLGPLVDRNSTRRIFIATQLVNAILVLVIPVAAALDVLSIWVLLAVLPVVTIINELVYPAQESAIPKLVDESNLTKANSLLSSSGQAANVAINAISGVLIAIVGAVTLFVVNSASFAIALLLFANIKPTALTDAERDSSNQSLVGETTEYVEDLKQAYSYVQKSLLPAFLLGSLVTNFTTGIMLGVLPVYAASLGGPQAYGLLSAAFSGGAFAGMLLASSVDDYPFGKFTAISFVAAGLAYAASIAISWLPITLVLFFVTVIPIGIYNVLLRTTIQSSVDDSLLGRVSALFRSVTSAALPLGSVAGGSIATVVGARTAMYSLVIGLIFFGIYMGIRSGIQSLAPASELDGEALGLDATPIDGASDEPVQS